MLRNIKLGKRLGMGFGLLALLIILMGVIAVIKVNSLKESIDLVVNDRMVKTRQGNDVIDAVNLSARAARNIVILRNDKALQEEQAKIDSAGTKITKIFDSLQETIKSEEGKKRLADAQASRAKYREELAQYMELAKAGQYDTATTYVMGQMRKDFNQYLTDVNELINFQTALANKDGEDALAQANQTVYTLLTVVVIALVLAALASILITRSIVSPLRNAINTADKIAVGDMSSDFKTEGRDEMNELMTSMSKMSDNIQKLIDEMKHMSKEHDLGDIDVIITEGLFQGAFKDMAEGVNKMVNGHINVKKKAMACIAEFGKGNFEAPLDQFPGKKAFINNTIEQVRANLKALITDATMLADAAVRGDLARRADASKHEGDFRRIVKGVNDTLDAIMNPINVLQAHLEKVSQGDLTAFIQENYSGDHASLKNALNATLDSLNDILGQVAAASSQVQIGSGELSSASQTVSQGSTESAASIEEISASMAELASQTKQNAENASMANQLASGARSTADVGNRQMENMVNAMNEIEGASRSISKIIKVIDEIAFQTNLLALNAAVEAARAGIHGKGFAVVAEEVRNLAARSAKAAKETTEMIENTITKVSNGSMIATETQKSLKEIVTAATRVSDLVSEINVASNEQSQGLQQVNQGISQLDAVTQQNSAAAEEAAASSEELNGQASLLIDAVGRFKLKNHGGQSNMRAMTTSNKPKKLMSAPKFELPPANDFDDDFSFEPPKTTPKSVKPSDIIDLDDPEFGKF